MKDEKRVRNCGDNYFSNNCNRSYYMFFLVMKKRLDNMCKPDIFSIFISVSIYCLNYYIFKPCLEGKIGYFCKCYLNDLVCPLFFFAISNCLLKIINKRIVGFRAIILFGLLMSFFWEYIGPVLNRNSVSDPIDIIFYMTGSVLYWIFLLSN